MTVAALPSRISYYEDGSTVDFAVPFRFKAASDLVVVRYANGARVPLTFGVNYSATGGETDAGGTLTVVAAAVAGTLLIIYRRTARSQPMVYVTNDRFPAKSHEEALDRLTLIAQEVGDQGDDVAARALLVPPGEIATPLPSEDLRRGRYLAFDADALPYGASGTGSDGALRTDLAGGGGGALVGFQLPGLTAVRSFAGRAEDRVSLFDNFSSAQRADVRNGALTLNINAYIQEIFDSGYKNVFMPDGRYWFGGFNDSRAIVDFRGHGDGISIEGDGGGQWVCQSATYWQPEFMCFHGNNDLYIGPIRFLDLGGDPDTMNGAAASPTGAVGIALHGTNQAGTVKASMQNINIASVTGNRLNKVVDCDGGDATHRVRGVNIGHLFSDDCYYGYAGNENGDDVVIAQLSAYQNKRALFVHGCDGVTAEIFNRNPRQTSGAVNISRLNGGFDTRGIALRYVARDVAVDITHVLINHIDLLGGRIQGVDLELDIEGSVGYDPVRFPNYTGSGGTETAAASSNIVTDVTIRGSVDANARQISVNASYLERGFLSITPARYLGFGPTVPQKFFLGRAIRNLDITFASAGGATNIGTGGTKSCDYDIIDGACDFEAKVTFGSTGLSLPAGLLTIALPVPARVGGRSMSLLVYDVSATTWQVSPARVSDDGSKIELLALSATAPFTFATGDKIVVAGSYLIS